MKSKLVLPLCATVVLLSVPSFAQNGGGGSDTLRTFPGISSGDNFGNSVANAGDVNADGIDDQIVGAPFADPGVLSDAGSAYVYSGADGSLLYQFDGFNDFDQFGISVSGAGDVNADGYADVIVGGHGADFLTFTTAGTAVVYSGIDGSVLHQWFGEADDYFFGFSVSGAGDTNGDGFDDLVIGAWKADSLNFAYTGAAYIYSGINGTRLHKIEGLNAHDNLGYSVSDAGDFNGDGYDDIFVGAPGMDPNNLYAAGSAFVYSGIDGLMLMQWNGTADYDSFGFTVANAGDLDGDNVADQIISAKGSGSVYVYTGGSGVATYHLSGASSGNYFGSGISGAGDLNGDGFGDFLIGASGANAAYAYSGANGLLLHQWNGLASGDGFGNVVDTAGDQDGDGLADVLIGAVVADPPGLWNSGAAYIFNFHTFISANIDAVSATTGGVLVLNMDFPVAAAGDDYKVLISATGAGPTNYGVDIPLTQDNVVIDSFFGIYPVPVYSNLHGTLDAAGNASGSLTIPAGIPAGLIGRTYYLAAIASQPGQLPEYSTAVVTLTITL